MSRRSRRWCPRETSLGRRRDCWHLPHAVKTLALEEIYAAPHKLDSDLDSGESVRQRTGLAEVGDDFEDVFDEIGQILPCRTCASVGADAR